MKTNHSPLNRHVVLAFGLALLIANAAELRAAIQPPASPALLNLDKQPAFDFGGDPAADPLFTPATLGLTHGMAGFDRASAVSSFAAAAKAVFPQSHEVFLAYWGNPRYALLNDPASAAASLAATNPLNLVMAFQSKGETGSGTIGGRGTVFSGEPLNVLLGGIEYEVIDNFWCSPLVLDLDTNGVLNASRGLWQPHPAMLTGPYVTFDINGDGFPDLTEWIGAGDALLTTSPNPSSGRDLVGTAGGWPDGFAHLEAAFDLDHNGRIEDAELNGLYVWQDANTNGFADPGEVLAAQSARIDGLVATHSGDYASSFRDPSGATGRMWDWWPNCAMVSRRSAAPASDGHPVVGVTALAPIRDLLFGRVVDDNVPPRTAGIASPIHLSRAQLAAAGVDLATFHLALLTDRGRVGIGYDAGGSSPAQPHRARLVRLSGKYENDLMDADFVSLPFAEVFQIACNPRGRTALVLGDQGSQLVLVDLENGVIAPADGLRLRAVSLRASGVAGHAGMFWFTARQLDEEGAAIDERVWALTPFGLWGGLSLSALKHELGQLRCYFVTGPRSGFFATPAAGGTGETLWWIDGTNRTTVAQADSFGGMHAVSNQVTYTWRTGTVYGWDSWWGHCNAARDTCHVAIATSSEPYFYPFLTDGGGTAIAAQLSPETGTLHYFAASGDQPPSEIASTFPGQGKVAWGAFAHYGTNGLELAPVADPEPAPPTRRVWRYTLLPDSQLIDDCFCGQPTILVPMRGTFELRLLEENPLFARYAVTNVSFVADAGGGTIYHVSGQGLYQVGGEVALALAQDLALELHIDNGFTNRLCCFTNDSPTVGRLRPMLKVHVDETNQPPPQFYRLDLVAAPLREIWFSTAHWFTPGVAPPFTNRVSADDLVSSIGRVVQRNRELTQRLGLQPSPDPPDLGLDAVDLLPAGEIAFSIEEDVFSQTLGPLHHGDVLSNRGRVVTNCADLINAFSPEPPPVDEGLDALHVLESGEIYFSITNDFFSERLGRMIRRGDLLSSRGAVLKTQEELLARFHPAFPKDDAGLDALWVWPSGEVWFSTETDFYDDHFQRFNPGDLLSDQGYVVYRNLDLLAPFQPLEDLGDFGLDALYVISDTTVPPGPARCVRIGREPGPSDLTLEWAAQGHAFQLEKATNVTGPYLPLSPITTETTFTDPGALTQSAQSFYRLRQW